MFLSSDKRSRPCRVIIVIVTTSATLQNEYSNEVRGGANQNPLRKKELALADDLTAALAKTDAREPIAFAKSAHD